MTGIEDQHLVDAGRPDRPASPGRTCSTPTPIRCPTFLREQRPYLQRRRRHLARTATCRGRGTSSRRSGSGAGSGSSPAGRSTSPRSATTSSTTSPTSRTSSCARRPARSRPTPTPACTAVASCKDLRRPLQRVPLPVPRLRLAPRRHAARTSRPLGLPPRRRPPRRLDLPEVQVGTWAGFVFINPDPDAEPLDDFLGELAEPLRAVAPRGPLRPGPRGQDHPLQLEDRPGGVLRGATTSSATHPQILPYVGDTNSQVDMYGNFARAITPGGDAEPAAHVGADRGGDPARDARRARGRAAARRSSRRARPPARPWPRRRPRAAGARCSATGSTSSATPSSWTTSTTRCSRTSTRGARFNRIVYRFRPNGDDHETAIFEVMFVTPFAGERPRPPRALARRRRAAGPTRPSSTASAWCWTRTRSTWSRCRSGLKILAPGRRHASRCTRRPSCAGARTCSTSGSSSVVTGGIRHPFTRALYEPDGSGGVRVTRDGVVGPLRARWPLDRGRAAGGRPRAVPVGLGPNRPTKHHRLSAVDDSHGPAG